ncbi:hypothetical protein [Sphaerisporangium sp. TRM90804]|uniref:hypothetical protein n=1 Tax=Sphaerisporangium sp. TRM90804 TaxID=3031113 RepID=UPI00244D02A2|nr:hypothetical protein [Sphaerisporangium sp. TRM90804]MDH2429838.1 hypothetical protein [Sphaerisporangium sp. TRM90804]
MSEMDQGGDESALDALDPLDDVADELDTEVPEADAIEQRLTLRTEQREWPLEIPYDVDPADAADQERVVDLDEDYR